MEAGKCDDEDECSSSPGTIPTNSVSDMENSRKDKQQKITEKITPSN